MKNNSRIAAICEGAMMTALSVLFLLIVRFVPVFWILALVAASTPTAALTIRRGLGISVVSVIAAVLVLFILTGDPLSSILSSAFYILPGLAIGYTLKRGCKFYTVLFSACITVALGLALDMMIINFAASGNGIEQMLQETVNIFKTAFNDALANVDIKEAEELSNSINQLIDQIPSIIKWYLPSFIIIASLVISYATLMFSIFILKRLKIFKGEALPFSMIKVPKSMCFITLVLALITNFSLDKGVLSAVFDNMVSIMYFVIGVSGFSFLDFLIKKKVKSGGIRFIIYLVAFFIGYIFIGVIMYALVIVGLIDGVRNIRKI